MMPICIKLAFSGVYKPKTMLMKTSCDAADAAGWVVADHQAHHRWIVRRHDFVGPGESGHIQFRNCFSGQRAINVLAKALHDFRATKQDSGNRKIHPVRVPHSRVLRIRTHEPATK